ncbi:hypothetical protein FIBSPDRAFT_905051 [Athelia psychrophila]|uniref:Uncharacterized protein n=1 Tax=Athelia psychrophila TaxID=1759441 RepID=A0A167TXY1_9AGAM|nr:hypothetical protein FIBSPDRAFT_905051 [Fibularhizoctonia sp. CBS 109695]
MALQQLLLPSLAAQGSCCGMVTHDVTMWEMWEMRGDVRRCEMEMWGTATYAYTAVGSEEYVLFRRLVDAVIIIEDVGFRWGDVNVRESDVDINRYGHCCNARPPPPSSIECKCRSPYAFGAADTCCCQ